MATVVAIIVALTGVMILGLTLMVTGFVQAIVAKGRGTAARAPLLVTVAGIVIAVAAAITLGAAPGLHLTYQTFTTAY